MDDLRISALRLVVALADFAGRQGGDVVINGDAWKVIERLMSDVEVEATSGLDRRSQQRVVTEASRPLRI
ncbi:MAG TPA: hypothetical protein PLL30_17575 [Candidatus Krumholzibacteria bacterium]|nr:hypothetical protein [Candidatus Krumholzibacteria bacterium]HPD73588.1 hypothetical protein [Candidatus Krumholzibacteria bacterium]HRY42272.1 hypothetical protein [Candidatus Krumholzibacteria bacterium]